MVIFFGHLENFLLASTEALNMWRVVTKVLIHAVPGSSENLNFPFTAHGWTRPL